MKKTTSILALVLLSACTCRAQRILFVGFDASATAFQGHGTNPYAGDFAQILQTVQPTDQVYVGLVTEKGLAGDSPKIAFTVRPFDFWKDQRSTYDRLVKQKLAAQGKALDDLLKSANPSRGTASFGYLFQASKILNASPQANRQLLIYSDGIQESNDLDIANMKLSDQEIDAVIAKERRSGRLPSLSGVSVWIITGSSLHGQISTGALLRVEAFWDKFIQASGGEGSLPFSSTSTTTAARGGKDSQEGQEFSR